MTSEEFQLATDLQRIRTIRAEWDALDPDLRESSMISRDEWSAKRREFREMDQRCQAAISIRASRVDKGKSRNGAEQQVLS